jgi:hypothetical protein
MRNPIRYLWQWSWLLLLLVLVALTHSLAGDGLAVLPQAVLTSLTHPTARRMWFTPPPTDRP